ncbi:MAG: VTT domain-containing protein, partial [Pseudohongiellaceae bacterium]
KFETINFFGLYTWLVVIVICLSFYFLKPELFEPQRIREFFNTNLIPGLGIYFVISTLRGFTLIPSTPIVLAGVLVFPPLPLFLVNQLAVYTSSSIVYYMARYLRFDHYFHEHYAKQVKTLTALLHKKEMPVIAAWGFFPFVPSDLIVYVCSVLRINVVKTLIGISIGEGVICAIYIFGGAYSLKAMFDYIAA